MDLAARLVHDSADFVAVDKPANWLSVPSRYEDRDPRPILGRELEQLLDARLFPIHRLDLEVSGLVLFAKNADAQKRANRWFEKRLVHKTYQGLSLARDFSHWPENLRRADEGIETGVEMKWRCRLLRGKRRSYEHAKGDDSQTLALCEGPAADGKWRWRLSPLTGRSHQLRFEMSRHGFPLLGDGLYGSRETFADGIALRAVELDLGDVPPEERGALPEILKVKGLWP